MPTAVYSYPLLKHLIAEWLSIFVLGRNRLVFGVARLVAEDVGETVFV